MSLTVTPLSPALGAQISGVDISRDITAEERDAIEQALLKHQVLFFRDQPISPSSRRALPPASATCTFTRSTQRAGNPAGAGARHGSHRCTR